MNTTNAQSDALLPCPFCGYTAADLSDGEYISCEGCGATGATADPHHPQSAAEAWNQRDPNAQGYVDAFYEMAGLLGVGAMPCSPAEAYRDHIKPRLLAALASSPPAPGGDAVRHATIAMTGVANTLAREGRSDDARRLREARDRIKTAATPAPAVGPEADWPTRVQAMRAEAAARQYAAPAVEREPVPDEVIQLMNHLEDVLPEDMLDRIDMNKWNAVTNRVFLERQRTPPAEAREPVGDAELRQQRDAAEQRAATLSRMLEERTFPSVEVTDAMVERGLRWYWPHDMKYADNQRDFMRRFLEAALAQPRDTPRDSGDAIRERLINAAGQFMVYARLGPIDGEPQEYLADVFQSILDDATAQSPTGEPT